MQRKVVKCLVVQPIEALQQSMSTACSRTSCLTTTCINSQPCQTFKSNSDPAVGEQPQNNIIMTQPLEDTTTQPPGNDIEVMEGLINDD